MSSQAARLASRAARQRRYRARQRTGQAVVSLSLDETALAIALIQTHQLTPEAALDRDRCREALNEMLQDWLDAWGEHAC